MNFENISSNLSSSKISKSKFKAADTWNMLMFRIMVSKLFFVTYSNYFRYDFEELSIQNAGFCNVNAAGKNVRRFEKHIV